MIQIQVRLYATLRKYRPEVAHGQSFTVELPAGSTVADLLRELGVPEGEMKRTFVNGIIQEAEYRLADGDSLGVFPPVAGGRAYCQAQHYRWSGPDLGGGSWSLLLRSYGLSRETPRQRPRFLSGAALAD